MTIKGTAPTPKGDLTPLNPGDEIAVRTPGLDFTYLSDPAKFREQLAGHTLLIHGQVVPADVDLAPRLLTTQEIRRVGALTVQEETNVNTDHFLSEQRKTYEGVSHRELMEELLRRDRNALLEGRQLQDGRLAGNLLRELTRHLLQTADHAALQKLSTAAGSKTLAIDDILTALGAAPMDKRMLRLYGTSLGSGMTEEEARAQVEALVDGRLAHTGDTTVGSADVADSIRERRERQIPAKVKE